MTMGGMSREPLVMLPFQSIHGWSGAQRSCKHHYQTYKPTVTTEGCTLLAIWMPATDRAYWSLESRRCQGGNPTAVHRTARRDCLDVYTYSRNNGKTKSALFSEADSCVIPRPDAVVSPFHLPSLFRRCRNLAPVGVCGV